MLFPLIALLLISSIMLLIKRKLPVWLPSPISWLKALGLAIPTWIGASAFFSLEVWHHVFLFALATISTRSLNPGVFFLLFAAGFLVISLVWYLLLILLYSLFLRLVLSKIPQFLQWLKPPSRRRDVLFGWAASTLAVLIGAAPFLLFTFYSSDLIVETMRKRMGIETEEAISKMFSGWFVATVYFYHLRSLSKLKTKNSQAHDTTQNSKPI